MHTLTPRWQRLVDASDKTCPRCASTEQEVQKAFEHLKHSLADTFGHDAGDLALRESGRLLRENLRKSDIACRYGGEEVVLVLPDSSLTDASQRVEQIRALIEKLDIRHGGQLMATMTMSAGVAAASEHGSTMEELIRAADDALYAAKHAGRNCIVAYRPRD